MDQISDKDEWSDKAVRKSFENGHRNACLILWRSCRSRCRERQLFLKAYSWYNKKIYYGEPKLRVNNLISVNGLQRMVRKMYGITQDELCDLIMQNKESMYRLAYSIVKNDADAQDAVGETIVTAFEKRKQIRKSASAKAWVMQILVNKCRRMLAKSYRVVLSDEMEKYDACAAFEQDEMWPVVMELEQEFREIVVLYYYEQFSVREISRMLDVPAGTVKSRLARARGKLAKLIQE